MCAHVHKHVCVKAKHWNQNALALIYQTILETILEVWRCSNCEKLVSSDS